MKKKGQEKDSSQKRKKQKKTPKVQKESASEQVKGEMLDLQFIKEGTLILGCVTEVRYNCASVSLPGCLVGSVKFSSVSRAFTEMLKDSTKEEQDEGVSLDSVIAVGAVYPCRVMQVSSREDLKKPIIDLSIDPKDVNEELRPNSLYTKMVIYGAVESVEDHGYVIDLGVKGTQGFLPFSLRCDNTTLTKGQVVATMVKKVPGPKSGNVVTLSYITFNETYPVVEDETLKLSSITPGTHLAVNVTNVKHPFYYMKFSKFDACTNVSCLSPSQRNLSEGMDVSGTVLYVHPVTHMIYLFVGSVPTPQTFQKFFSIKKHDVLKNVQYEFGWHNKLFFKLSKGQTGFIKKGEIPEKGEFSHESLLNTPVVPKSRVVFLHYLDNLVQLSFKESVINQVIVSIEDVKIGDIFEATVKKHIESGMFVQICPGLSGLVRRVFMSDVLLTMPEKLFKPDSKVKCRVLSKSHSSGLTLTCKDSLLNIPESELLKSYEEAVEGQSYKGVIVQKADSHILVAFFNDVKGLVPSEEVPKSSLFYVGHTVSCKVTHCNPPKQRLRLSMVGGKSSGSKVSKKQKEPERELSAKDIELREAYEPMKKQKAVITKVTGHQLNIVVNKNFKGRVHITQVGKNEENTLPLLEFSPGMKLKVHVLGQCSKKTHNFLPISHRVLSKNYMECSLVYPPPVSMDKKLQPGMQVTGYVKEVTNTFATLWLSPVCVGTLDFVNFSDNAKVLRKLKKVLKIGLSLEVTVLKIGAKSSFSSGHSSILLTRLGTKPLQPGMNVIGLVEKANCEGGLTLRLPQGYSGRVGLTDMQDVWGPLEHELSKCQRLRYVLCNLVDVDHSSKSCVASLRKSRLYGHPTKDCAPELTKLGEGELHRGFVSKCTAEGELTVELGRGLVGRVQAHGCAVLNCDLCERTQSVLGKCKPGTIVQVKVQGKVKGEYSLLLPELEDLEISEVKSSRLKIKEDIDWDEV